MKNALEEANLPIESIDHINVHGTSTPLGAVAEIKPVQKLFGDHAYNIQINSTKSMTGHLLGAAGAVEAVSVVGSIMHNLIPPTINHFTDDENLDPNLNFTFNKAVEKEV